MYLKISYDIKIGDDVKKERAAKLAEQLADVIAAWAEAHEVEATGIVELQEESDG